MGTAEMEAIGDIIYRVLASPEAPEVLEEARQRREKLCRDFPLYDDLV
jgi:glycine/serine hydroxymethyltransferase